MNGVDPLLLQQISSNLPGIVMVGLAATIIAQERQRRVEARERKAEEREARDQSQKNLETMMEVVSRNSASNEGLSSTIADLKRRLGE